MADSSADAFRVAHPDPVAERGFTWTPGEPRDTLARDDVHDRIDMVHVRPRAGAALRVAQAYTMDRHPWPSDHRAVIVGLSMPTPCPADFNNDGTLDSQDFFDFLSAFFTGCG